MEARDQTQRRRTAHSKKQAIKEAVTVNIGVNVRTNGKPFTHINPPATAKKAAKIVHEGNISLF